MVLSRPLSDHSQIRRVQISTTTTFLFTSILKRKVKLSRLLSIEIKISHLYYGTNYEYLGNVILRKAV